MVAEARILFVIMLLLFIIGIWNVVAIAHFMRSLVQLLAEGEGLSKVYVSFYPPRNGTILISYEVFVEPNPLVVGSKYAQLRIIICDFTNRVLWADEVYKNVKTAVKVATDYVAIDIDKIQGLTPYRVYVTVRKVTWGTLKKLRVEIKHNPYVKSTTYSPMTLTVEILSACALPFIIALTLPKTLIKWCKGARALLLILTIALLYIVFRYFLHRTLGMLINPIDYVKALLFIK